MARYGKEHKQRTRRRIVETSGRRLKTDGVTGSGIATLMADAGLTNGAFYAHFTSKDDLVASVITDQLGTQREAIAALPPDSGVEQLIRAYLSAQHRDHPGDGCPSAALLNELGRGADTVRQAFTTGILEVIDALAARLDYADPSSARSRILAAFAGMVGTMQMARAVTDPQLSDDLLEQGVQNALATLRDPSLEDTAADGAHR
jgi:TetR/AcrR family transcriptional repressor of nem operon